MTYEGNARIDGVPGTAAPVLQNFPEAAGSTCGALLPTGNAVDAVDGVEVTCIDNGMPVVVLRASDLDITGYESREDLDGERGAEGAAGVDPASGGTADEPGRCRGEVRPEDDLGRPAPRWRRHRYTDVHPAPLPRLDRGARRGERRHPPACPAGIERPRPGARCRPATEKLVSVEHPSGETSVMMNVSLEDEALRVSKAAVLRTARKLFEGRVFPRCVP